MRQMMLGGVMMMSSLLGGQKHGTAAHEVQRIPMPAERASESYQIYASLMPLGETAGEGWPHALWLVSETTIAPVGDDATCYVSSDPKDSFHDTMNPHTAVHPTEDRKEDFDEILADWDRHCHDRIALDPAAWKTKVPVRLVSPEEAKECEATRYTSAKKPEEAPEKFRGAPALYSFSEVYFNAHHTVGLVYATHWCGGLCGEGMWLAVELKGEQWVPLPWRASQWIS